MFAGSSELHLKKRRSQSSDSLVLRAQHLGFRVGVGAGLVLP